MRNIYELFRRVRKNSERVILNNRKLNNARRQKFQFVRSEPEYTVVRESKNELGQIERKYKKNPNSIIIKLITHRNKTK